jgi:hypothetical protein
MNASNARPSNFRIAAAAALLALGACSGGSQAPSNDPNAVMHLIESAKAPIPVSCRVRPATGNAAAVEATIRNTAAKPIVGADLTVTDGAATSLFVPLAIRAGSVGIVRRTVPLGTAPSDRATCSLSLVQFADKSGWQYVPASASP